MMTDPFQIVIGAREIYDAVVRLTDTVNQLVGHRTEDHDQLVDHENRIRSLEKGRWPIPALTVLIALAAFGVALAQFLR